LAQDEASMLVARLLEPAPGRRWPNVCAGARHQDHGTWPSSWTTAAGILALDPQPARLAA